MFNTGWLYPRHFIEWDTLRFVPDEKTVTDVSPAQIELPVQVFSSLKGKSSYSIVICDRRIIPTLANGYTKERVAWTYYPIYEFGSSGSGPAYVIEASKQEDFYLSFSYRITQDENITCKAEISYDGSTWETSSRKYFYMNQVPDEEISVVEENVFKINVNQNNIAVNADICKKTQRITSGGDWTTTNVFTSISYTFAHKTYNQDNYSQEIIQYVRLTFTCDEKYVMYTGVWDSSLFIRQPIQEFFLNKNMSTKKVGSQLR